MYSFMLPYVVQFLVECLSTAKAGALLPLNVHSSVTSPAAANSTYLDTTQRPVLCSLSHRSWLFERKDFARAAARSTSTVTTATAVAPLKPCRTHTTGSGHGSIGRAMYSFMLPYVLQFLVECLSTAKAGALLPLNVHSSVTSPATANSTYLDTTQRPVPCSLSHRSWLFERKDFARAAARSTSTVTTATPVAPLKPCRTHTTGSGHGSIGRAMYSFMLPYVVQFLVECLSTAKAGALLPLNVHSSVTSPATANSTYLDTTQRPVPCSLSHRSWLFERKDFARAAARSTSTVTTATPVAPLKPCRTHTTGSGHGSIGRAMYSFMLPYVVQFLVECLSTAKAGALLPLNVHSSVTSPATANSTYLDTTQRPVPCSLSHRSWLFERKDFARAAARSTSTVTTATPVAPLKPCRTHTTGSGHGSIGRAMYSFMLPYVVQFLVECLSTAKAGALLPLNVHSSVTSPATANSTYLDTTQRPVPCSLSHRSWLFERKDFARAAARSTSTVTTATPVAPLKPCRTHTTGSGHGSIGRAMYSFMLPYVVQFLVECLSTAKAGALLPLNVHS
ncbi:hypothetical protein MTO96_026609 [Rhipicephalus appendiculatus]